METKKAILRIALPAALGAVAVGALWAQRGEDPPQPGQQGLTKVAPRAGAQARELTGEFDARSWRERLSQEDLDLREQAFEQALRAAARDARLRAQLEQWASDSDGELAWTSRLALRQLEQGLDPFAPLRGDAWPALPPSMDPQELLDLGFGRLQGRQPDWLGAMPPLPPIGGGQPNVQAQAESFSFELGPDGVKAKVTREKDGESVTEEYEAESLEELLEAHPELREHLQVQGLGASPFGGMQGRGGLDLRQALPRLRLDPRAVDPGQGFGADPLGSGAGPMRTDVLGVYVHPLGDEERARRNLQDLEGGLVVERSVPGTIAASLGLQRGHVLVELNGRALSSAEDISAVLSARGEDEGLELVLLDRWGQRRTRAWSPAETLERAPHAPRAGDPRRL